MIKLCKVAAPVQNVFNIVYFKYIFSLLDSNSFLVLSFFSRANYSVGRTIKIMEPFN